MAETMFLLLDSAGDAIVVAAEDGSVVLVNGRAQTLFGYARHELLGQPIETLVAERHRAALSTHRGYYCEGSKPPPERAGLDVAGRRNDGSEFAAAIDLLPASTPEGRFVTAVIRDLTQHKHLLERLALATGALEEAKLRAEQAERSRSEFLAQMGHELRGPLNAIIGLSELLHDGKAGPMAPVQKESLGDVIASGRRLLRVINEGIELARAGSGAPQGPTARRDPVPVAEALDRRPPPSAVPGGPLVLIVDDDPVIFKLVEPALRERGYLTICIPDSRAGLRAAAVKRPAAVVLDLLMPEMDGFEFLMRLRSTEAGRNTPVIVWTGKDLGAEERASLLSSAQGLIMKGDGSTEALLRALSDCVPLPETPPGQRH